jgi:uncharacterized protein (TIGR00255 family)
MILSMTGLGLAQSEAGAFHGAVVIRSLNHRFLELTVRVSRTLVPLESAIRDLIQSRVRRGRVEASVRGDWSGAVAEVSVSRPLVKSLVATLRGLGAEHDLRDDLSLASLLQVPGLLELGEAVQAPDARGRDEVLRLVGQALEGLSAMRQAEGARLAIVVEGHLEGIVAAVRRIGSLAESSRGQRQAEIAERAREVRETLGLDEARLYQEVARLVERADICEELARLDGHVAQARTTLAGGEACGKALDFLAQEMMREANTIGSKAAAGSVIREVIGLKSEIERFREQVQNLE